MEPFQRHFIIKLGKALHKYGTPAYRLATHMQKVAEHMGVKGHFIVTPISLTFVLWQGDEAQEQTYVIRVKPGEIDLGQLARTNQLVDKLITDRITLEEATEGLTNIMERKSGYHMITMMMAFAVSSGAFAMLMKASWGDILVASLLGIISFFLAIRSETSPRLIDTFETLSAFLCALAAVLVNHYISDINIPIVALSAIIIFIPGLSLTIGLSELAARELISGTARVMDAMMMLFKLFIGVALGLAIGQLIVGPSAISEPVLMPIWIQWLGVICLTMGLSVVFKVRPKDLPWAFLSGCLAYAASIWANAVVGDSLGSFVGAFVVAVYANLYARISKSPASVVLLTGIILLVPGSKAYLSLSGIVSGEVLLNSPDLGVQTFLIFMSIIAGILFANMVVPSNRAL